MTDAELLARFVRSKDQAAFAEIVKRHAGLVVGAARRLAPRDADDVAQATFFLLAQRAAKLLGRASLAGWLYETATNCARNAARSRARHERKLALNAARGVATEAERPPTDADLGALLDAGLSKLPAAMRDVVLLRHVESLSVAETAARLGVAATTVTKRTERGLSRLRDFFVARGHTSVGTVAVAALLATQAGPVAPAAAATLAAAGTGKATPAATAIAAGVGAAKPTLAVAAVSAAAAVLAAAATVAILLPAWPTNAVATNVPATTGAPTAGDASQQAARAAAAAFLDALRAGDEATLARLIVVDRGATASAAELARTYVDTLRDGAYAAYPERLALGGSAQWLRAGPAFATDGTRSPGASAGRYLEANLEALTPSESEPARLVVTLKPAGDVWRVTAATFVDDGRLPDDPADAGDTPATLPAAKLAAAIEAWDRCDAAIRGLRIELPADARRPAYRASLVALASGIADLARTLEGSPLAIAKADETQLLNVANGLIATIDTGPPGAIEARLEEMKRRSDAAGATGRLERTAARLERLRDLADEASPARARPPSFGPAWPLRLGWSGERVRIRGPLVVPAWLSSTRAYRRWERRGEADTLRTRDAAGNVYAVAVTGRSTDAQGRAVPTVESVRQYRPDGTLAAVARHTYGVPVPTEWGELDATGKRYRFLVRVNGDGRGGHFVSQVRFFAGDGAIREWAISVARNADTVKSESLADPVGDGLRWTHLLNEAGQDKATPPETLPLDGLPIEREP